MKRIYMDNNATTPLHPGVKDVIRDSIGIFGNASSFHSFGREARKYIEESRKDVANLIGAEPQEIIFMGSGSEANNTVLNIFACKCPHCDDTVTCSKEIITSSVEHPCVLRTSECLQEKGIKVTYAEVDKFGKVDLDRLAKTITGNTGLVSIMTANNEIGTIMDIKKISDMARKKGALMHTDAVQAVGKIPVDVNALGVDFLTMSAHKIYGPKGVGALYVRKGTIFCPMIRGGHQEQGRRAGTENTLGIIAFGAAAKFIGEEMDEDSKRIFNLREKLRNGIIKRIPHIHINGHLIDTLPGTLNISFEGVEGESVLLYLDLEGIAVSTGSACASGSLDPSHVLLATGLAQEAAHGSIRFSLGRENTEQEVDMVLEILPKVIGKVRSISTAYGSVR
ncbi:MAG: IscS subfamily cysteine desulfurase [Candidatus Omnitrophica bacterium]|nr:IscS subfamily cysteine desulfurase [Candidatus Omnitrophota bacterium]